MENVVLTIHLLLALALIALVLLQRSEGGGLGLGGGGGGDGVMSIPQGYTGPIVDLKTSRQRAIDAFKDLKS